MGNKLTHEEELTRIPKPKRDDPSNEQIATLRAEILTLTNLVQQLSTKQEDTKPEKEEPKPEKEELKEEEEETKKDDTPKTPEFPQPEKTARDAIAPRDRFRELARKNPREAGKYFKEHSKDIFAGQSLFVE